MKRNIQFTCTNLDGSQKEGVIFLICFRKRGYPERGGSLRKVGGSNPGGNYDKFLMFYFCERKCFFHTKIPGNFQE